ncbi:MULTISPECIES: M23 family metallopeptidase [Paenibacillus]|uniref:Stage II sporulation protein Q n=1 Tax=Paenibacillus albilobatus TaxID=2716884 RepID=A0A919XJ66_9BACL|nr:MULTISPECIES: M23 family metallopeptidase [Paenibacillus]MDR9853400.1 M23 family metallopeptidase [Paenibacillus sp. VCA1]GIO33181.1 stage II sporulation protein Q [Paenibacillus albilobatus]
MNEQNKSNQNHGETPKKSQGELVNQPSSWKKLLSKRWVYPAAYVAAAAIILTLVWVYQDASMKKLPQDPAKVSETAKTPTASEAGKETKNDKAVEVTATVEDMAWPVADAKDIKVVKPFFDENGTPESNQAAMVQYNDTFMPNVGVDLARDDDKTFEVKAALGGKVTRVEVNPPLTGTVIEITHDNDVKTVYQALSDAKVKEGDVVKQGDPIGTAGRSEIEKDLGNHLHFEVHEKGTPVNPEELLPKK